MSATNILRIRTLGRVAIERDGLAVTDLASRKVEALLIYLACTGRQHPREVLAELLWDDRSQRQAMTNLRVVLSSLRKTLGPYVSISRTTAAVDSDANLFLDTAQLEAAVSAAQAAQGIHSTAAAEQLAAAIELYQGDFLAGFFVTEASSFETWAAVERERLHRLALDGLQRLGRWYLSEGQYGKAMAASTRLLELDPLAEAGHRQLMEALARRGQRSEALAVYEGLEATLWRELAVEPSRATLELVEAIRADRLGVPRATPVVQAKPPIRLPAPATPLLGRETELEEIQSLFLEHGARLVTIIGPGGIGKTSLALEAARQLVDHFAGGAAFISLAPLSLDEAIVPSLAQALRFKPAGEGGETHDARQQLLDYLRDKTLFLLFDNFEHLLDGATFLADILSAAPHSKLLVTSREPLKLQNEHLFRLEGLTLTDWKSPEQAMRDPAVQLFLQVGRRVRPGFQLLLEQLDAVRSILKLVQGMPLAVILAASWLEMLEPTMIAAEIERSLDFLKADYRDLPQRQRSMRAVFDSTWERLSAREQLLFAALSVFRGGFTHEAAQEVAGASLRDLLGLVGRSLVIRTDQGRFEVHELLRQFAIEQLARSPEEEPARERHSAHFLTLLRSSEADLKNARVETTLEALAADIANISAAWDWALARQQFGTLSAGAFSLATFYMRFGRHEEGLAPFGKTVDQLRLLVAQTNAFDARDLSALACLLTWTCAFQLSSGILDHAELLADEALSVLERPELHDVDTRKERALALLWLGGVYTGQDRSAEAQPILQESLSLFNAVSDIWHTACSNYLLGGVALRRAEFAKAVDYYRRAMQLFGQLGDRGWKAAAEGALGYALGGLGKWEEAEKRMRASIDVYREIGEQVFVGREMTLLAETITYRGRFEEALALAAESIRQGEYLGSRMDWLRVAQTRWCCAAIHIGEYETVLPRLHGLLDAARETDSAMRSGYLRFLSGCARLALGEAPPARHELQEAANGLRQIGALDYLCETLAVLSCALTRAGDPSQAGERLVEAASIARKLSVTFFLAPVLAAAGLFLATVPEVERAIELYALASREPFVAHSRWYEDVIGRPITAAAAGLAPEQIAAAKTRGEALDPWETAGELLQQLKATDT